jgi:hypothetical protein
MITDGDGFRSFNGETSISSSAQITNQRHYSLNLAIGDRKAAAILLTLLTLC